jgi:hypothetical protein
MEYLSVPLKDGTTYGEYLEESVLYRKEITDMFADQVLFSLMDEDDLLVLAKQTVTELLPDKDLFLSEDDYNEVFNEVLTELVPY